MKNKGFTLVELLAVIVILAIIALIATPIVLNIIQDTRDSATIRSGEFYISAAEQAIMRYNMNNLGEYFNPTECEVTSGNLKCIDAKNTEKDINVDIDGEKPTEGTIIFENGKVTNGTTLTFENGRTVKMKDGKLQPSKADDNQSATAGVFTLSNDFDNSGTVSTGDTVSINGESFAVLPSVTRASEISLIAQQNITIADSPRQSASAGTITFADTIYWANYNESISTYEMIDGYSDGGTVYNENSNLYQYIEAYEDYLETLGLTGVSVTIPKPSDIYSDLSNNCLIDGVSWVGYGDPCVPALSSGVLEPNDYGFWLDYLLDYLGNGDTHILKVEKIYSNGDIGIVALNDYPVNAHLAGIRPVITIPSSLLGL